MEDRDNYAVIGLAWYDDMSRRLWEMEQEVEELRSLANEYKSESTQYYAETQRQAVAIDQKDAEIADLRRRISEMAVLVPEEEAPNAPESD